MLYRLPSIEPDGVAGIRGIVLQNCRNVAGVELQASVRDIDDLVQHTAAGVAVLDRAVVEHSGTAVAAACSLIIDDRVGLVGTPAGKGDVGEHHHRGSIRMLGLDVKGNVVSPGVYTLPAGSRVQDAITAAGGFCNEEDGLQINLAKKLTDGEMILVGPVEQQSNLININTAGAEELDSLPGIGEVLSQRILQYREEYGSFYTIEDLKNVQGIGNSVFDKLKDLITV